jgi:hypothetical protein
MQKIRKIPGIALTSLSSDVPASGSTWTSLMQYRPDGKQEVSYSIEVKFGDTNYLSLFHIPLLAGRNILPCDTVKELIINENYLHLLGFRHPEEAIGKSINMDHYTPIVGVMKDFHSHPLNMEIKPMAYSFSGNYCKTVIIALAPQNSGGDGWKSAIASIDKAYKGVYPGEEFSYDFLDKSIANFYEREENISRLLKWATGLTAGPRHLYHQPQGERNWHPQSAGRIGLTDRSHIVEGFYQTGGTRLCHRHSDSLVGASCMAESVCVQDDDELVDVWAEWTWHDRGFPAYVKPPNYPGCES